MFLGYISRKTDISVQKYAVDGSRQTDFLENSRKTVIYE
jgi:hypothetical protein